MLDPNTTALLNQLGFDAGLVETLLSSAIWITVLAFVTAIPTGIIAKRKGRSRTLWFLGLLGMVWVISHDNQMAEAVWLVRRD